MHHAVDQPNRNERCRTRRHTVRLQGVFLLGLRLIARHRDRLARGARLFQTDKHLREPASGPLLIGG
jgi:hypothetical protein